MAQLTPSPDSESPSSIHHDIKPEVDPGISQNVDQLVGEFILNTDPVNDRSGWKLPTLPAPIRLIFRPMLFGAVGIHGLLLFTPLTSQPQAKTKEKAEPIKVSRLSDKVLVKSMPKVKVTTAPKPVLPKVATAASNPIVLKSPDPIKVEDKKPEEKKPEEKKPEDKKPEDKKPEDKKPEDKKVEDQPTPASDKGVDPDKVDPSKRTTDAKEASKLKEESQQFASLIAKLQPDESAGFQPTCDDMSSLGVDSTQFCIKGNEGMTYVGPSDVDTVTASLKAEFSEQFAKKTDYGGGNLYEAKIGNAVRYISVVKASSGVLIFQWEKSPVS